ncbi:uricase-like isoform X2 [Mizuhopecten yessoensis]|uniref:uricase-like isoform X2 n=1 Tax=Mizuhopecten yessoensis TaxID=6573 RepID=UPI000B457FE9|nr:uricase-like isoform X2 [Mizuhopecten yessoensis]
MRESNNYEMKNQVVHTEFVDTGYGKNYVKLLQLRREGDAHHIQELEVSVELTLNNQREYLYGDNTDIIATDSQKNTVYILARKFGVKTPEQFALLLCNHFLTKYSHVDKAKVYIEQAPWKRMEIDGDKHVHAFLISDEATRFCDCVQARGGKPLVSAGLKKMKILKTTQSAFTGFVKDEFRTLPDANDRLFCTVVDSKWWYNTVDHVNFDKVWDTVKQVILETFAGPAHEGVFSPSVQNTLFITEKHVLAGVPQIEKMEMELPNVHYFGVDFTRFPKINFENNTNEIYMPTDKPSGNIRAAIERKHMSKL